MFICHASVFTNPPSSGPRSFRIGSVARICTLRLFSLAFDLVLLICWAERIVAVLVWARFPRAHRRSAGLISQGGLRLATIGAKMASLS